MCSKTVFSAALWLAGWLAFAPAATAKNTGLIFVGNEKSNTITVLNRNDEVKIGRAHV